MPTRADIQTLARLLIDFRGRADRRAMGAVTVGLLVVQLALAAVFGLLDALSSPLFLAINALLLWVGATVILRRLHDIGWSGWWIFAAVAFWLGGAMLITTLLAFAVGPARFAEVLVAYPLLHGALVVGLSLPPFGGLLWLQACPGMVGTNRFGGVPNAFGFSVPAAATAAHEHLPEMVTASA